MRRLKPKRLFHILALTAAFTGMSFVWAQNAEQPAAKEVDPKAQKVLRAVSDYYSSLDGISLTATVNMDRTFQGQQQSMSAGVEYDMQRPNRFAISPADDAEVRVGVVRSDGDTLNVYVPQLGKYTSAPTPESLDQLFDDRTLDLLSAGSASLVTALMREDPYAEVMRDVATLSYVGQEKVDSKDAHRLRLNNGQATMDLWVAAGDKPRVIQVVPDLSPQIAQARAAGQDVDLKMSLVLSEQKDNPELGEEAFSFEPPAGAQKVASFFEQPEHPMQGKAAPDFALAALDDQQVKLSSHKGEDVVILDFWATWCGPCVQAMPVIEEVADAFKDRNVVLYAVNQRESKAQIEEFLKEQKLDVNVLLDTDGAVGNAYGVRGIPQTVIIDKTGKIAKVHVGFSPQLKQQLTAELEQLTAK